MSLNLANLLTQSAADHPDKTAIVLDERSLSYRELLDQVQRLAGALDALGVRRGDKLALMLPNVTEFTVAYFAGHFVGAPIVALNVLLTADEVEYHLRDSEAVALVVWAGCLERAEPGARRVPGCRQVIVAGASSALPTHTVALEALIATAAPRQEAVATSPDETAVLLYTSGTTGKPKGAELSHFNLFHNAEFVCNTLLPMPAEQAVALATLPLFHSFGQSVVQNRFLMGGGTLVLLPRFAAQSVFELVQRHRVTFFAGVPTMYVALLEHARATGHALESLKYCVSGGAALPVEVLAAFEARFGVQLLEGYGLSETSPVASFNSLDRARKVGSIGTPIRGVQFRLLDDADAVVSVPDTPGEICIRGPNVMKGYYNKPDATAEALRDGWFRTGDIGVRDADGYYFIVDRKKDMILRGGFSVYPREVEEVLYAHPAVQEAAVIGLPHPTHGEEVCAVIALAPGAAAGEREIREHCRQHLAAYKYPRVVKFVASLPKGPTGKILKRELRGQFVAAVASAAGAVSPS